METVETVVRTARTVEEAEELALKELGVDRNEVEVEVLNRGKAGFLGIGAELAQVRVTRIAPGGAAGAEAEVAEAGAGDAVAEAGDAVAEAGDAVPESPVPPPPATPDPTAAEGEADAPPVSEASAAAPVPPEVGEGTAAGLGLAALHNILSLSGVNVACTVRTANDPDAGGPIIDLTGDDSGLLIGRRGQTLQSLQFVVNMIVRKEFGEGTRVVLDVERYRQRREASLRDMANKVAERVSQTGRSITLEPMSAADRRIIHISLAESEGVSTESVGFGEDRKVTIIPKR